MKMPVWKFVVVMIVTISLSIALIEEIVMMKAFHFMNHLANHFSVMFQEDKEEMDRDDKKYKEFADKWHEDFQKGWDEMDKVQKEILARNKKS